MIALEVGQVFDGERLLRGGLRVTVAGDRIAGVTPLSAPAPPSRTVFSSPGATVLPGLIDTHVHLCCDAGPAAMEQLPALDEPDLARLIESALTAHLASGVTTVRDLGDVRWAVLDWRARQREPHGWPTVLGSGPPITRPGGHCANMGGAILDLYGLRRAVRQRAERGADVVKIMASGGLMTPGTDGSAAQFSVAELRAVVREAHALGLAVTAHAHASAAIGNAVAAGVAGIEHCTFLTTDGMRLDGGLVAALGTAGTWVCPTLGLDQDLPVPVEVSARLCAMGLDYPAMVRATAEMHRAGVRIASGTDGGINPAKRHGMLPDAVIDLVQAGVPAGSALATATSAAADACGLTDRKGRMLPGLDADLLVVDGDPLTDITALYRVEAVYLRGHRVLPPGGVADPPPGCA